MTKATGRNDACPCGSGKKYKYCCLGKEQSSNPDIPWPTFPEEYVIGELLRSSTEFAAFYHSERGKVQGPVLWAKDASLPPGIDHRCTTVTNGTQVIRLRRVPAILGDAQKIAHELGHFVLNNEGFPCTGARPQYELVSSALNSMILDPLVNSRLQRYGFDLQNDYQTELKETVSQLSTQQHPPSDHLRRLLWIFNYVSNVLDWELISRDRPNEADNAFRPWFDKRYPDVAKEAQELLALVRSIGYDTPPKQSTLFRSIIQKYGLDGIVFL